VSATVLVLLALAIGVIPHMDQHARVAAFTMADRAGYQARVLDGAKLPDLEPEPERTPLASSLRRSFGTTAAALGIAFLTLAPWYPRKSKRYTPLRDAMEFLRTFHTGHVGDYVAFLSFGVAAFGVVLGLLIQYFRM